MLNFLQKKFNFNFNTQNKRVLKKSRIRGSKRHNSIWSQVVSFTGSRHLGEMKTSGHQGTLQFF